MCSPELRTKKKQIFAARSATRGPCLPILPSPAAPTSLPMLQRVLILLAEALSENKSFQRFGEASRVHDG